MTEPTDPARFRIAIAGAGIAGLTAAIALLKYPLIDVQIYEQASKLKEIGASIALGPNGLRTLQRLDLQDAISDEFGFRGPSGLPMIYRHWKTNEVIGTDVHESVEEPLHHTARFHRAHLQAALLKHLPKGIIHLTKRISDVGIDGDHGVSLRFEDGTSATADMLLGADGLHSAVRKVFVPDFELKWSGWTAFRATFEASLAGSIPDLPLDSAHWWGPTTTFFASRLGKGQYTTVGGVFGDPDDPDTPYRKASWDADGDLEAFKEIYTDWHPVIKRLSEVTPKVRLYPNFACSTNLETWIFHDRVALIGDAAHAHGGAHATGGSLAIDDVYALSLAITSAFPADAKRKPSTIEVSKALKLYEMVRKPHAERLLRMVHAANEARVQKLRSGNFELGDDLRARAAKGSNTNWLHEHDVERAFKEVTERSRTNAGEVKM